MDRCEGERHPEQANADLGKAAAMTALPPRLHQGREAPLLKD
jgi:hypothetical protein